MSTVLENRSLKVKQGVGTPKTVIKVKGIEIGGNDPLVIAGPCSIESLDQLETTAKGLSEKGIQLLRGGAFKPRTSPYSFQGLGIEGLKMMREIANRYGMLTVSEIMSETQLDAVEYIDIIQIGSRNMQNFSLLKEVGAIRKPVFLKRGFMATVEEFLLAAEYIHSYGNPEIILCERGIRTFETSTRFTLDIGAIALLKQETHLPVFVDLSHSLGRIDLMQCVGQAVLAAGISGVMIEVHNCPAEALSDAKQQLNLSQFADLMDAWGL